MRFLEIVPCLFEGTLVFVTVGIDVSFERIPIGLVASCSGEPVEVSDLVGTVVDEVSSLLLVEGVPPGRVLGGRPVLVRMVWHADDLVIAALISIGGAVVVDVAHRVVQVGVDLVGILDDLFDRRLEVGSSDQRPLFRFLIFVVGIRANGPVSIDRAVVFGGVGLHVLDVRHDRGDAVVGALDGHKCAVDVRGEPRERRHVL